MIQEQVISYLLETKDASVLTLNNITADYFCNYKNEFYFIKNHLQQYGIIPDKETFLEVFSDFDLINVKEPASYLLEELAQEKTKNFLFENYNKVRDLMKNNNTTEALQLLKEASEQSASFVTMQPVDLFKDISRLDSYKDKLENRDKYFITTGFRELDAILGGWDVNEDLVTIVARNGLGKSWVLFKCAAEAAKAGKNVGIYSGEMSEDSVGYRIDSILGHISNGALVHGGASVKNEYEHYLKTLQNMKGSLKVITPKTINGSAGVSALRAFVEKEHLDILFIDQHSLLEDDKGAKNPVEKASNISKDLKLLQTIKRIPIICVCQQNRDKLDNGKAFDTTQLAQSDRIGQDSSNIIFIERKDDLMKLHLVKSRQASCGDVLTYRIDLNHGTWAFVPDENSPTIPEDSMNDDIDVTDPDDLTPPVRYSEDDVF